MESYEKIREIGKGSYGVVWLVKHKKDRKNFVLKRIDLRKSSDRDKQAAQQEAQLLKSLKHPNIVSYRESFQSEGYLHIVMLYCDGGDLYSIIKEQNGKYIEETQVVEWFVQIAMALQYMHEKNILHRDLKTQNIFLTKNKIIKVGDLGIARVLKGTNDMATTIIGTPYYMSPELFSNKPYNSKSDVWALGCVVYEMTTLKHAFNAKDMSSLVFKITRGKMPPIPTHYSKEFISLIESMLSLQPEKRPSANKILRDSFIKQNIMLFLEKTKQKQLSNQQNEQKSKEQNRPVSIRLNPSQSDESNAKKVQLQPQLPAQKIPSPSPRSEFVLLNNHQKLMEQKPQEPPVQQRKLNELKERSNSDADMRNEAAERDPVEQQRSKSSLDGMAAKKKPVRAVRISNIVENIDDETEKYQISPIGSDSEIENDYDKKPYELTRPVKLSNFENQPANQVVKESNQAQKKFDHEPVIAISAPKIQTPVTPVIAKEDMNNSNLENISARERRRLRLRLSQNDDSKPPVLKKIVLKSNQSEVFYKPSTPQASKPVSKSFNDDRPELQDSLKIIKRGSNPSLASTPVVKESNDESKIHHIRSASDIEGKHSKIGHILSPAQASQQHQQQQQHFGNKANSPAANASNLSTPSSSSSSVASSNEDNDFAKEKMIEDKIRKKENKELCTLIDKLSSTLKINSNNQQSDTDEEEDIKEELIEDTDEDDDSGRVKEAQKPIAKQNQEKVKYTFDFESDDDIDNKDVIMKKPVSKNNANDDHIKNVAAAANNHNNLGITNHMTNRINGLEKECLEAFGREKLDQAFKILESFKENETEKRLTALIGRTLYKEYSGKLWLLKFCKDTAKISIK